jgi:hypothetical protein
MDLHLLDNFRAPRMHAGTSRDPAFDDLGDSFWLGGEAMVAPACMSALRDADRISAEECADPAWLAI